MRKIDYISRSTLRLNYIPPTNSINPFKQQEYMNKPNPEYTEQNNNYISRNNIYVNTPQNSIPNDLSLIHI